LALPLPPFKTNVAMGFAGTKLLLEKSDIVFVHEVPVE
jgi:hypothetical protein